MTDVFKNRTETIRDLDGNEVFKNPKYATRVNPWAEWENMPEFKPCAYDSWHQIKVEFDNDAAVKEFNKIFEQDLGERSNSMYYPKRKVGDYTSLRWNEEEVKEYTKLRYPFYVISKSRWEKRLTSDSLVRMKVPHYMVIEEPQFEEYNSRVNHDYVTLLVLPEKYKEDYEKLDDLGLTKSTGPGPARNFCWDHSIELGAARHWVSDDNCAHFYRLNGNKRRICETGAIFRAMEDHTERYENIAISGPHYRFFAIPKPELPPFTVNTRIYSTLLIRNDIPFRWRGRFNEDTILSLDVLTAGYATMQYNAFLTGKLLTQSIGGGNTEEFYSKEGTRNKSDMLEKEYPQYAKTVWKFGRFHHHVDYSDFETIDPKKKKDIDYPVDPEYNLVLLPYVGEGSEDDAED